MSVLAHPPGPEPTPIPVDTPPTVRRRLAEIRACLAGDSAALEAQLLLCQVLGRPRSWLFAHGETVLESAQIRSLHALVTRRQAGEPLAYILGQRAFWDVELTLTPAVLIPRPETELLVEQALAHLQGIQSPEVIDLGTGSGAIAIAIARSRPDARVLATDASPAALAVARDNIQRLAPGRVALHLGRWLQGLAGRRFHLLLANPPYIASDDPHLQAGDVAFEPRQALVAGSSGLDDLRAIATAAGEHLLPGGRVLLEHGFEQGEAVRQLLRDAGLQGVQTLRDLAGLERVASAMRAREPASRPVK